MEKYRPKNSLYSEIAQAVWNNKNDPRKSIGISFSQTNANTAIGKEKLSILFSHSFYTKVSFSKNQY